MSKENWIWMPHAGHYICSAYCRFKLNTYVNGYIISTVGEHFPDSAIRRIYLETRIFFNDDEKEKKAKELLKKVGDEFDHEYLKHFGFEEIGFGRLYETMVFGSKESGLICCPYKIDVSREIELDGYNTPEDAYIGHYAMCEKYDKLKEKHIKNEKEAEEKEQNGTI